MAETLQSFGVLGLHESRRKQKKIDRNLRTAYLTTFCLSALVS